MRAGLVLVLLLATTMVYADVYMHNPRGSNNRLNGNGRAVNNNNRLMDTQNNDHGGYCWGPPLHYYVGSHLMVEWTAQHGCQNPKVMCNMVLQYMCGGEVRDGATTTRIPDDAATYNQRVRPNPLTGENESVFLYGMHESFQYYQDCKTRERNKGLFTADQNMNNRNSARHTRQDNNGQRRGFECNEERDYYPYWHPTPWKDIAVLVADMDRCDYFRSESQNVKDKNYCSNMAHNNQEACEENGAEWQTIEAWGIDPPECLPAPVSRVNHLGNVSPNMYASSYNWTIPDDQNENCVLRLRYNISTADYQGWADDEGEFVDQRLNGEDISPVQQDEIVPYFDHAYELALNTDQYGRTFQDRSHVFEIRERPSNIPDSARIWNLNVRGKRGNIVQVYPAVEYDFVPNRLHARVGDYIHYQWTGCDTNPANNDGEGTQQTDRSNIAQMRDLMENYPDDTPDDPMFDNRDTQVRMAFVDQEDCIITDDEQDVRNCRKLNAGPRYFNGGVLRVNRTGEWSYMCTRNNNFSNRSQKGIIIVDPLLPTWSVVVIAGASLVFVGAAVVGGALLYAQSHPASPIAAGLTSVNAM